MDDVGAVSGGAPSGLYQVTLVKGQQDQQAKVASTIIDSATDTAPITGKGQNLNVLA